MVTEVVLSTLWRRVVRAGVGQVGDGLSVSPGTVYVGSSTVCPSILVEVGSGVRDTRPWDDPGEVGGGRGPEEAVK